MMSSCCQNDRRDLLSGSEFSRRCRRQFLLILSVLLQLCLFQLLLHSSPPLLPGGRYSARDPVNRCLFGQRLPTSSF